MYTTATQGRRHYYCEQLLALDPTQFSLPLKDLLHFHLQFPHMHTAPAVTMVLAVRGKQCLTVMYYNLTTFC